MRHSPGQTGRSLLSVHVDPPRSLPASPLPATRPSARPSSKDDVNCLLGEKLVTRGALDGLGWTVRIALRVVTEVKADQAAVIGNRRDPNLKWKKCSCIPSSTRGAGD